MSGGSEGEMELQQPPPPPQLSSSLATDTCERIKHHRKQFYGCNGVQSAIPRKQRSAINKRNRKSTSPPPLPAAKKLEKSSTGIELPQTKGSKKLKQNRRQGGVSSRSPKWALSTSITKDEEEVVETLYGLATMFSDEKLERSREDEKLSEAPEAAIEESVKYRDAHTIAEVTNLSPCVEGSRTETIKDYPLTKSTVHEQHTIFARHQVDRPLVQANPERVSFSPKGEHIQDNPMDDANLAASFEMVTGIRIKGPRGLELVHDQKHQNTLWPFSSAALEQQQLQPVINNKGSCARVACEEGNPTLWPGFSVSQSNAGSVSCPSSWSTSNKDPSCLDSTKYVAGSSSTTRCVALNNEGNSVLQQVVADRKKPWKKSTVHVHICYLIQASQTADKNAKATDRSNLDVKSTNGVIDLRNGWDAAISSRINDKEIVQEKGLPQDQQLAAEAYGNGASSNQGCDFLSLSTGGHGSLEFTTPYDQNHGRNAMKSSVQNIAPNLCSISQCHSEMPLSLPNAWYLSPLYPADALKTADKQQQQQQQRQFMDGSFYSTQHSAQAGLANQQNHQRMWAAKLATENGSGRTMPDLPKRHNRTADFLKEPGSQAILPFFASLEKLSSNICPRPVQQHLFFVPSSTSSTKRKRQFHQQLLPNHYDLGGGFYAHGSPQLICNSEQF